MQALQGPEERSRTAPVNESKRALLFLIATSPDGGMARLEKVIHRMSTSSRIGTPISVFTGTTINTDQNTSSSRALKLNILRLLASLALFTFLFNFHSAYRGH